VKNGELCPKQTFTKNTLIIDGCEYLFYENGYPGNNAYSMTMCHKGNCKNPIHIYTKEQNDPEKQLYLKLKEKFEK
jgi:hypothetical protein